MKKFNIAIAVAGILAAGSLAVGADGRCRPDRRLERRRHD